MRKATPIPKAPSRGSELLKKWQGKLLQQQACLLLDLDEATYSRFVSGVRKPTAEIAFRIETATQDLVPAKSWWEEPVASARPKRRAS